MKHLINRKQVRQFALEAVKQRSHPFTRVSAEFYDRCEASLREFIRHHIHQMPSVGRTIR